MYGLWPYFLTKNLVDQPLLFLAPLLQLLVQYWGVGYYPSFLCFGQMYLTLMLIAQCAAGLGFMVSTSVEDMATASAISNLITLPAILFGGLFVNDSSVFGFLKWIQWISPIRYAFECLLIAEWKPRGEEFIYQQILGFGDRLDFGDLILALLALCIFARIISVVAIRVNIKKF